MTKTGTGFLFVYCILSDDLAILSASEFYRDAAASMTRPPGSSGQGVAAQRPARNLKRVLGL